jgi:hypothetical protein
MALLFLGLTFILFLPSATYVSRATPQPPSVSGFIGVEAGQTISGTVGIEAHVTGENITSVEFTLDGPKMTTWSERYVPYVFLGNAGNGTPLGWRTVEFPNGDYTLTAVVTDAAGQRGTGSVSFKVTNGMPIEPMPPEDPPPPEPLIFPSDAMRNVKDYGAKGDGVTNDTAAILRALEASPDDVVAHTGDSAPERLRALYFPAGTYLVSDTLRWTVCCVTLQGQGPSVSVIKLQNDTPGFNDPRERKPVLATPFGNAAFAHNIFDLTVDVGSGNPGAVGIDYLSNKHGAIKNVIIRAGDRKGKVGLDMTRTRPAPALIQRVRVEGFDYGISVSNAEYSPTFEHITLTNQNIAGMYNNGNTLTIREIRSFNSVPAIKSALPFSSLVVLGGTFEGGAPNVSAIESEGYLYARSVASKGYLSAIRVKTTVIPGASQREYVSDKVFSLFASPQKSLNLPIRETPLFHDNDPNNWGRAGADLRELQALLNSGKSTIYFPPGVYDVLEQVVVTVPATVRRIVGFGAQINTGSEGGIVLRVEEKGRHSLIIENFADGVAVEHAARRNVALKHGSYDYRSSPGAGRLFLDAVRMNALDLDKSQRVWARQLNLDGAGGKIANQGAKLWLLGLNSSGKETIITTTDGGKTELLGGLIYPAEAFSPEEKQRPAFVSRDSSQSLIYSLSSYCSDCMYDLQVEETRADETKRLLTSEIGRRMPLFVGYR